MNVFIIITILAVLIWCAIYTVSYGIWTVKENKKGGVALFILALACLLIPIYLLWIRV